jgi:hypothetical protein
MLDGRQPIYMPRVKRDIESFVCYPASRIHPAYSVTNTDGAQIERNVLCENRRILWIVLIFDVVAKLKQGLIVNMKSIGFRVADVFHAKKRGAVAPLNSGTA